MKLKRSIFLSLFFLSVLFFLTSCEDWESGSQVNFNTSGGEFSGNLDEVTVSGTYFGTLGGGRAVSDPFAGTITSLELSQNGTGLVVVDNQGSTYSGSVGDILREEVVRRNLESGSVIASWSVNWIGFDAVAIEDVFFTGTIQLIFSPTDGDSNTTFELSGTWNEEFAGRIRINTVAAEATGPEI